MIIAGQSGSYSDTALSTSTPSIPSIFRSVMTKSTMFFLSSCSPSAPDAATSVVWSILRMICCSPTRIVSLSSMIRIVAMVLSFSYGRRAAPLRFASRPAPGY